MANFAIPNILKHCTVAVYRNGGYAARNEKERFERALKIAKSRLQEYGYLTLAGEDVDSPVTLTPKGRAREQKHRREGRAKSVLFDTLYAKFDIDGSRAAKEKKQLERATEELLAQKDKRAGKAKR